MNTLAQGRMVPVPGGVLIQDDGVLLGAIGVGQKRRWLRQMTKSAPSQVSRRRGYRQVPDS